MKMWTWTRKIILSFLSNTGLHPMEQNFTLGATQFFNWRLLGFQKCRLKKYTVGVVVDLNLH